MAMIRVDPVEVRVRADWFDGRPRSIHWDDETVAVTRVAAVRDERRAYAADTGPRLIFEVETPKARLALSFLQRTRTWTIEARDEAA